MVEFWEGFIFGMIAMGIISGAVFTYIYNK